MAKWQLPIKDGWSNWKIAVLPDAGPVSEEQAIEWCTDRPVEEMEVGYFEQYEGEIRIAIRPLRLNPPPFAATENSILIP